MNIAKELLFSLFFLLISTACSTPPQKTYDTNLSSIIERNKWEAQKAKDEYRNFQLQTSGK